MTDQLIPAPPQVQRGSGKMLPFLLALPAAAWLISIAQMRGMSMGAATDLGSLGHFMGTWVPMMAAMMLPGTTIVLRRHHDTRKAPGFLLSYLGMWTAIGLVAYAVYRPHGNTATGAALLAAGLYELTPLKRRCRERCAQGTRTGTTYGVACLGSSIGIMAILFALDPMSIPLMAAATVVVTGQKLFPAAWPVEITLAFTAAACGIWILT